VGCVQIRSSRTNLVASVGPLYVVSKIHVIAWIGFLLSSTHIILGKSWCIFMRHEQKEFLCELSINPFLCKRSS